jgi:glutamyl-tRNA synthetase
MLQDWNTAAIEEALRVLAEELGEKPRKLFQPIRVAVSGRLISPPLFESLEILGREETLGRLVMAEDIALA